MYLISFSLYVFLICLGPTLARRCHVINFRSRNLFPEGLTWDPLAQHFIVGSIHQRTIHAVSDRGVIETLISDSSLPENVSFAGLVVDTVYYRLLAAVHALEPLPPFDALAAYDLRTGRRLFLARLTDGDSSVRQTANAVAVDFKGNVYVGKGSSCGLNGIAYLSKGYLLVVQSNTGKMFKVYPGDGKARLVLLTKDLPLADGMAVKGDGGIVVVSQRKAWFLKSHNGWREAAVYDEIALDVEKFPTSVAIREDKWAYVIYRHALEGLRGNVERGWFSSEEMESRKCLYT